MASVLKPSMEEFLLTRLDDVRRTHGDHNMESVKPKPHFGSYGEHGNAMVFEHEPLPLLPALPRFEAVTNVDSDEYSESECVIIGLYFDLDTALQQAN